MEGSKNSIWKQAVFLRIIIPLMLGIVVAWYGLPDVTVPRPLFLSGSLFGALLSWILVEYSGDRLSRWVNMLLFLFIFFLGAGLTIQQDHSRRTDFAGRYLEDSSQVVLRLLEPPVEKPASWKAEADIMLVDNEGKIHQTSGKAIVYFQKKDSLFPLHYGDVVITTNRLQPIRNSGNPGAFNYKRYCSWQNIFYQAYLPDGAWNKLSITRTNPLRTFFLACRSWTLKTLSAYIHDDQALGIAEALLVGYRDNLDKELVQAYANAGVVHIIAISGLHLALIYAILLLLLRPVPERGHGRWLKGIIIILSLWCFVMITGAAPSALRAAVMFSFITIAKFIMRRHANIYNTLAASAFLLLCYDPFLLFDVGFQLSYLAVLGIVIFQKPIFNSLVSKSRIWNFFWKMMAVSIAAELLTFPVAIFYFHRFPVLFLVANLAIIPLSSFILYGEILLLVVSFLKPVAALAGMVISKSIAVMNAIIAWINQLTFSGLSGLSFSVAETVLLYVFIAAIALWLLQKRSKALVAALLFLLCFSVGKMISRMEAASQKSIIVYNVSHHRAIDFVEGRSAYFIGDSLDVLLRRYNILPSRIQFSAAEKDSLNHLVMVRNVIRFFDRKIVCLDSNTIAYETKISMPVDYVILSHNAPVNFRQIKQIFSPELVIFDASNASWKIEKWKTACNQLNLRCFSVPEEGAWRLNIK